MSRGARDLAALPRPFQRSTPVAGLGVVGCRSVRRSTSGAQARSHCWCMRRVRSCALAARDHAFSQMRRSTSSTASAGRSPSPSSETATETNGDPAGWSMRLPRARFATRRGFANAIRHRLRGATVYARPGPEQKRGTRPVDPRPAHSAGCRERERMMPNNPPVPSGPMVITVLRDSRDAPGQITQNGRRRITLRARMLLPCSGKPIRARCS